MEKWMSVIRTVMSFDRGFDLIANVTRWDG